MRALRDGDALILPEAGGARFCSVRRIQALNDEVVRHFFIAILPFTIPADSNAHYVRISFNGSGLERKNNISVR